MHATFQTSLDEPHHRQKLKGIAGKREKKKKKKTSSSHSKHRKKLEILYLQGMAGTHAVLNPVAIRGAPESLLPLNVL